MLQHRWMRLKMTVYKCLFETPLVSDLSYTCKCDMQKYPLYREYFPHFMEIDDLNVCIERMHGN